MKRILLVSFIALLVAITTACGQDKASNDQKEASNNNESEEVAKETEGDEQNEEANKEEPKDEEIYLNKGEMVVVDDFSEFTLIDTKFSKKIEPPNPGSFYSYYEAKEAGTTYFDIVITLKSLLTSGKSSDEFASVKVIFNEKYEYDTFSIIEDNGGSDFTYTNITSIEPLKSGTLHFLAEVPEEVEIGTEPLSLIVSVGGKEFSYKVR